jgi:hypothetical protein
MRSGGVLVLLITACGTNVDEELSASEITVIDVDDTCPGEPALVESISIEGDQLTYVAGHGGCDVAKMWVCWNGTFLESFPVQAQLVVHNAPAGNCDAFFTQTHTLPLEPVSDAYLDAYQRVDPIVVRVGQQSQTWNF